MLIGIKFLLAIKIIIKKNSQNQAPKENEKKKITIKDYKGYIQK